MYLKSLEINGFKSFGKKAELEFSSPIVSIVGPNGSGKSNVAEAFRFVLGEQSIKSMRGKRGEDMIFTGSKALGKLSRASVKLTFDNLQRHFPIDFTEVTVERVVYRDGTNEYILNGSKVRLKDVVELLASANIGASGHHIISQGEADRILNASTKERKEMVEDALGLKIYQYKREESERKLTKTAENIAQVNALRKEIAPHIRFLEKQVEKIQKAESLREELIELYREYLKREETYLKHRKETLEAEQKGPQEEKEKLEKRLEDVKRLVEKSDGADSDSRELLSVERELRDIEEKLDTVRREMSRIEGTLFAEERLFEKAKRQAHSAAPVNLSEIEGLQRDAEEILRKAESEQDVVSVRKMIGNIVSLLKQFIAEKKSGESQASEQVGLEKEILELRKKRDGLGAEEKSLVLKRSEVEERYNDVKRTIEEGRVKGREAEREMFTLLNRRTELLGILQAILVKFTDLARDEDAFKSELVEATALAGVEAIRYTNIELPKDFLEDQRSDQEDRKKRLEKIKIRLEEAGGAGGAEVMKEFDDIKKRDEYLTKEITDLEVSAESLKGLIAELSEKLSTEFKTGTEKINKAFNEFFTLMFGGGHAHLEVSEREVKRRRVSEFDDLESEAEEGGEAETEEGIDIDVSLPNKRVKGLQMLSGGERALTSIALLFAISQVNPPPFVILDETDAALDEANSKKYGDMIESLSKYSQLILITHNRETMSRAGILYGVTMGADGISKLLSVKFEEAVAVAK